MNFHQDLIRFDWSINQKHSLYGRWIHDQNTLTDPYGYFDVRSQFSGSGWVRLRWSYLHGATIYSRLVQIFGH